MSVPASPSVRALRSLVMLLLLLLLLLAMPFPQAQGSRKDPVYGGPEVCCQRVPRRPQHERHHYGRRHGHQPQPERRRTLHVTTTSVVPPALLLRSTTYLPLPLARPCTLLLTDCFFLCAVVPSVALSLLLCTHVTPTHATTTGCILEVRRQPPPHSPRPRWGSIRDVDADTWV